MIKAIGFYNLRTAIGANSFVATNVSPLSNITIENCMFYRDADAYYDYGQGIELKYVTDCTIKGCYFGSNHSLTDDYFLEDGIVLDNSTGQPSRITIGGTGTDGNTFYNFQRGVYLTSKNANYAATDYVRITRNRFLKYADPTYYFNLAVYMATWNNLGVTVWSNESIATPLVTETDLVNQVIKGTSGANYLIEVFESDGPQTAISYVGSTTADASGNWSFHPSGIILNSQMRFVATATDVSLVNGVPKNNTSQLSTLNTCREPIVRIDPNCSDAPILSIIDTYDNIEWYKGTTLVQTGGTSLNTNCTSCGSGSYTVVVSNTSGNCSFTSGAVTVQ